MCHSGTGGTRGQRPANPSQLRNGSSASWSSARFVAPKFVAWRFLALSVCYRSGESRSRIRSGLYTTELQWHQLSVFAAVLYGFESCRGTEFDVEKQAAGRSVPGRNLGAAHAER